MSEKQPEALRLAGQLESGEPVTGSAAAKLRRLHEVNQGLLEALQKAVRYGGLFPDLKAEADAAIAKATGEAK